MAEGSARALLRKEASIRGLGAPGLQNCAEAACIDHRRLDLGEEPLLIEIDLRCWSMERSGYRPVRLRAN